MKKRAKFKLSLSVFDLPIFMSLDELFARLKATGIDGVEVIPGFKTRWNLKTLKKLADKHALPVLSFHQPPWSVLGWWLDEDFLAKASDIGIRKITFHPLARYSFADAPMKRYLEKLAKLKEKYGLNIFLENMPPIANLFIVKKLLPYSSDVTSPLKTFNAAKEFGLQINLDTSHALSLAPHQEKWFETIYPGIGNIHLSSFNEERDHLPLQFGTFKAHEFVQNLVARGYHGLITFEINYPKRFNLFKFDFDSVKKSVDIVKQASV